MDKAVIHDKKPAILELEAGTYWWCACGRSKTQPWCDRSHQGTGHTPVKTECTEAKRVAMCNCKQTKNPPYCDGSHASL
ncbi:MAG: CDGSH iron-sulfur domain-containing protein [Candidatus Hydrogenedentes bacterium]|nr:CDGSH iron-sulfur domain-containing protein [Candidatus Hydrogenedentota bacterium]MDK1020766.1 CDGSH iron-sulfur domain-containing protein [Candidatus Hydrogenedentota bacterium]